MAEPGAFFKGVRVDGDHPLDCRTEAGVVAELGEHLRPRPDDVLVDGAGGALVPGLADHHLHLVAMAAAARSVDIADVSRAQAASRIATTAPDDTGWLRVVGYDDGHHGDLDRAVLDSWQPLVPVRVQHRSGSLWVLNSAGLAQLPAAARQVLERDAAGPTGRLWRGDHTIRPLGFTRPPSLVAVSAQLARWGITHVADASPGEAVNPLLERAVETSELVQHVMVMTAQAPHPRSRLRTGPVKLVVSDHKLPKVDELARAIASAHRSGRDVAIHAVTSTALALTLAALDVAGPRPGDRIEHCAVANGRAVEEIAKRRLRVVTQPSLVTRRGDDYWARTDPDDRSSLWPYATLLRAGVPVAPSSDAPYGDADPWAGLRAAAGRRTASGRVVGPDERVPTTVAWRALLSPLGDPGGPARRVTVGAPADLVLLDAPLAHVLADPRGDRVRLTMVEGRIVHGDDQVR